MKAFLFGLGTWILVFGFIAVSFSGCFPNNKRLYIGMDDYGDTKKYHQDWDTKGSRPLYDWQKEK